MLLEARTALHLAADAGDDEMVQLLLMEGADVHARDRGGKQAIHLATISGHIEVVADLLNAGAMVDSREPGEGMTHLLIANLQGEVDLVQLLVNAGADIEATNATGRTPFFFSTSMFYMSLGLGANVMRQARAASVSTRPGSDFQIARPNVRTSGSRSTRMRAFSASHQAASSRLC